MEFKPAQRKRAKLRLGVAGPSGSGKSYSSLLLASGIAPWSKIAVIDTENGSAELYAHLGSYSVLTLEPPYDPDKYIAAIKLAEQQGFEVIIIDSLSHAWAGEGGILDQQGRATDSKFKGNSWAAWREFTPKHNALVEAMLKSSCHVIATMRSKTEYTQVTENGKPTIKKLGMAPVQRDGMEYEFTIVFDLSIEHVATTSKDRTSIFDGQYFKPDKETGCKLLSWLNCESNKSAGLSNQQETNSLILATNAAPQTDRINEYRIVSSEPKTKNNGQVFAKVALMGRDGKLIAWSVEPEILDLPPGTLINAELAQKNRTTIIEKYSITKGGEAA